MSDLNLLENRTFKKEIKNQINLYLFQRRYQKALEGKFIWEDKALQALTAVSTKVTVSWRHFVKRSFDIVFSSIALIAGAPLMAIIAIAIKADSAGPVLFKQTRVGMKGRIFNMYKFRTMRQDAEANSGPIWAQQNDPRVTLIGNFLRKTHLDELPQLYNVLSGEMSLVGPRPERPYFVNEFRKVIPHYDRRLCVKPGITGLAQIKRRYDETLADVKKKLKYDVLYAQKMCPLLDVKVMFLTLGTVIFGTGR